MRTELWGLRDRETHEPIYTYFASSNPHRAIFAKKKSAEMACQHPMSKRYEPFKITGYESIDPVHAAGGCRCEKCKFRGDIGCTHAYYDAEGNLRFAAPYMTERDGCTRGVPKEEK